MTNAVDIRQLSNTELSMRLKTSVHNGKVFHTDLNGMHMRRRETLAKLPLNANFFPLPVMAYLEDAKARVTVHTRSPLGCAGLEDGWLEIVQDRRLMQDDKRGLNQVCPAPVTVRVCTRPLPHGSTHE